MRKACDILKESTLFQGLDHEIYHRICSGIDLTLFWKGECIVNEGDLCEGIIVIMDGRAAIQKISPRGDVSMLDVLGPGESFGDDLLFGQRRHYQVSLTAASNGKYLFIRQNELLELIADSPRLLTKILCSLSDTVQEQERRINLLSQRTLRQKISAYLIGLLRDQLEDRGETLSELLEEDRVPTVELPHSKEMVARLLAMPRPSLSRELISMEKDGLIESEGREIRLLDMDGLIYGDEF